MTNQNHAYADTLEAAAADPNWHLRREGESELAHEIRIFWHEHRRRGPFQYGAFWIRDGEIPETWFPPDEVPITDEVMREWLTRAKAYVADLKAAMSEIDKKEAAPT